MAIRTSSRVRILKGTRKGEEATVAEVRNGYYLLEGDERQYPRDFLQEIPS